MLSNIYSTEPNQYSFFFIKQKLLQSKHKIINSEQILWLDYSNYTINKVTYLSTYLFLVDIFELHIREHESYQYVKSLHWKSKY